MEDEEVFIDEEHTVLDSQTSYYHGLAVVALKGIEYDVPFRFMTSYNDTEDGVDTFLGIDREDVEFSTPREGKISEETLVTLEGMVKKEFEGR